MSPEQTTAPTAERILTGGRIYTGRPEQFVDALAVADGRIVRTGTLDEVMTCAGPNTTVHDVGGRFVMPGFVDVHNHHAVAGRGELFELTVPLSATLEELLEQVALHSRDLPADAWVTGGSWPSTSMAEISTQESLRALDRAAGGRPVILTDDSMHNRWVSSRALELAGITKDSIPDVGETLLDPQSGEPTGVLLEGAGLRVEAVHAAQAPFTDEQNMRSSERGIEILSSFGFTSFQDAAVSVEILSALKRLDDHDRLNAWVVSSMAVNDEIFGYPLVGDPLIARGEEFRTHHHRPDFVKVFLDGVPPAQTAAFIEPYLPDDGHEAHHHGHTTFSPEELLSVLRGAASRGLSAKVHCTGDASVRAVLDAVEVLRGEGYTSNRFHIAHGQFVHPDDLPRFATLDVVADASPFLWVPGVIPSAIAEVLPAERAGRMQPVRSLLDTGATLAGGTDWPVSESPNAWEGIQGLVTRADPLGAFPGTLWPEEAVSVTEAIAAFTIQGARAMGIDDVTGTLEVGKSADFIVVDQDPFSVEPTRLIETRVLETWFSGRRVFALDPA